MPLRFRPRFIAAIPYEAAAVCDVDGDGVLDIVCGGLWFQGPDFKRWHNMGDVRREGEYHDDFSGIVMDVNGDGRPDIITGGWWGESLRWRQNPGKPGTPWKDTVFAPGIGNIETTRAWDIDGDGHLEIVPNTPYAQQGLCAFRLERDAAGKGTGNFAKHILYPECVGHGLGCGDVDGDGRPELITGKGILKAPAAGAWTGPWTMTPGPDFGHGDLSIPIICEDIDGDGEAELIVGHAHSYGLDWYDRQKDGSWKRHPIDPFASQYHDLHWVDIDGDGQKELVTGKRWRAHCGNDPGEFDDVGIYCFKWTGDGFAKHVISHGEPGVGKGCGIHFAIADLRKTGRLDIVAPGKDGLWVFENLG